MTLTPGAPALREVLERLEDLPPGSGGGGADLNYDTHLSAGVAHFQDRHGLKADGALGKSTLAALQAPLERRMRQISLTLERWRWLRPFKTPPLIVNIPQYRLFAFRTTEDRVADILQMNVIVGRAYANTQTPVFEGAMTYVVLRPYWDIPRSILRNEMLPKIRANPGYLSAQRLEIVNGQSDSSPVVPPTPENIEALAAGRLRIRQQPGEDNALGLAKFMFPNVYNVYLHSTPAHNLFKESVRAFSHGCIRVADPLALATLVLKNAEGDVEPRADRGGDERRQHPARAAQAVDRRADSLRHGAGHRGRAGVLFRGYLRLRPQARTAACPGPGGALTLAAYQ